MLKHARAAVCLVLLLLLAGCSAGNEATPKKATQSLCGDCGIYACDDWNGVCFDWCRDELECAPGVACDGEHCIDPPQESDGPCGLYASNGGGCYEDCRNDTMCSAAAYCYQSSVCKRNHCYGLTVEDNDNCTQDSCSPATGTVTHIPYPPEYGCVSDPCTPNGADRTIGSSDGCGGICGGGMSGCQTDQDCDDGNPCNGHEFCQPSGSCAPQDTSVLDDFNPCTIDTCDESGIHHTPVAARSFCSNDNACDGEEICDGLGHCLAGTPPALDDGNPCTADVCDAITGISHMPMAAGISCSDGNVCNGEERCDARGTCGLHASSQPLVSFDYDFYWPSTFGLDDGDPCTADSCDPVMGFKHELILGCAGATPGSQLELHASIMGRVIAVGGSPVTNFTAAVFNDRLDVPARGDVVTTINLDGTFRIRLTAFPQTATAQTPPQRVLIRLSSDDFPSLLRTVYLRPGDAVALGDLVTLQRDPNVTVIGPGGGTAQDSQGTLSLTIPAGALSQPAAIRLTPIATRAQFPTPLPSNTVTMYGMEIEPSGTTLASPATLRIKNTLNLPTTMKIPVGTIDPVYGDWTHEGFATWDGTRFSTTIQHFSPHDCNGPRLGELVEFVKEGNNRNKGKSKRCAASAVNESNGALEQAFDVPLQSARRTRLLVDVELHERAERFREGWPGTHCAGATAQRGRLP